MSNDAEIEIELEKRKESNSTPSNSPQAFLAPSTHASGVRTEFMCTKVRFTVIANENMKQFKL